MTFAQTWLRQALGAAGASLLAPLAILLAAGILAAGGGLGGLSELGQISSGPTLPASDLDAGVPSIADADIVGADLDAAGGGGEPGVPSATGGEGADGFTGAPGGTAPLPSPLADVPATPVGGGGGGGVNEAPPAPTLESPATAPGGPAGEIVETTRGLQMVVPEPIRPVTDDLINLLLGPAQP